MKNTYIYGFVMNNRFYSANMRVTVEQPDGIYRVNVSDPAYLDTIEIADIEQLKTYARNMKRMPIVNGLSYKDSFIPFDIIKWDKEKELDIETITMPKWITNVPSKKEVELFKFLLQF